MFESILHQLERKQKLIVITFFALFFIASISIVKDYGLSWDEEYQWRDNGEIVYNYIFHHGTKALLEGNEKYHGPAFELILVFIQKAFNLTDTRDVYLVRHFVTFLSFFIGVIFFYFLCKRCFKSWKIALTGCIFLVLSPRIFADSFYNSKDLPFLVSFIIGMYALLVYHEKPTHKTAILFALASAFSIDTRVLGIILPLTSFGFLWIELVHSTIVNKKTRINYASTATYIVLLIAFTILFWPVLWEEPIYHFTAAFAEMSKYHWGGNVLYLGEYIKASNLPWHYLPVWIGVSTPVAYLLLFLIGLFYIVKQFYSGANNSIIQRQQHALILICMFLPIIMVIALKSAVYDGWRHVFFIYPAFIMIALYGLKYMYTLLLKWKKAVIICLMLIIGFNFTQLICLHPHEYVYFNFLAGKDMKTAKANFELDYYGVSSKEALEYILAHDPSTELKIHAEQTPQRLNVQYLTDEQRSRIRFVDLEYADYFVCQYRFHKHPYDFKNEFFSVKVGNASIMSVFKLTPAERAMLGPQGKSWMKYTNDFESQSPYWSNNHLFKPVTGAHSGTLVTMVDSANKFSDVLKFSLPPTLCNKEGNALKINFWKYEDLEVQSSLVVNVSDSASYFWKGIKPETVNGSMKKWEHTATTIQLPIIRSPKDTISVYILNGGQKQLFIDDIEVELIEKKGKQYKIEYFNKKQD